MISEEEYKTAKSIVKAYKEQELNRIRSIFPQIEVDAKNILKKTIKKFKIHLEDLFDDKIHVVILSENPIFDEDYSGEFDKEFDDLSKKYQLTISFEPYNYSK